MSSPIVLDTGIVIGALTGREGSYKNQLVDAIRGGRVPFVTSEDFFTELYRVVAYEDVEPFIWSPARAIRTVIDLFTLGRKLSPTRYPWPSVTDEKDHWMLDLAWEAKAAYIISEDSHLSGVAMPFNVEILSAREAMEKLAV